MVWVTTHELISRPFADNPDGVHADKRATFA
jgi:hypothetical protein